MAQFLSELFSSLWGGDRPKSRDKKPNSSKRSSHFNTRYVQELVAVVPDLLRVPFQLHRLTLVPSPQSA
jgi:hypothetical protein